MIGDAPRVFVEDVSLLPWVGVRDIQPWAGILLGNGASIALWNDFRYGSLFEQARSSVDHPLTVDDLGLFDALSTANFEQVLAALKTSRTVLQALQFDVAFLAERYASVQRALFEAVHSVHVPWGAGIRFDRRLATIRQELRRYQRVYSLNYDLIVYWSIMSEEKGRGFVDYFWNADLVFNSEDTTPPASVPADCTRVLYLHGGIHLRRHLNGTTYKARASGSNLLDQFTTTYASDSTPLLVSEGHPDDKYRSILRSDYLEFGFRSLSADDQPLVVFGTSLRSEDAHLVRAINRQPTRALAVSLRPNDAGDVIVQRKAELRVAFPSADLYFFDATSHPLGDPDLRVRTLRSLLPFGT